MSSNHVGCDRLGSEQVGKRISELSSLNMDAAEVHRQPGLPLGGQNTDIQTACDIERFAGVAESRGARLAVPDDDDQSRQVWHEL